jgi:predicted site-specific integrase-resolvase
VNELLLVVIPGLLTLVGVLYAAWSSRRNTELANQIEGVKTQALSKAETIKVSTEAESKRLDSLLDTQSEFIKDLQAENRAQRQEMLDKDKLHREEMLQVRADVTEVTKFMNNCVAARQEQEKTIRELSDKVLDLQARLMDQQHPA